MADFETDVVEMYEVEQFLTDENIPFVWEGACFKDVDDGLWYVQTPDGHKEIQDGDYVSKSEEGEFDLVSEDEFDEGWEWLAE